MTQLETITKTKEAIDTEVEQETSTEQGKVQHIVFEGWHKLDDSGERTGEYDSYQDTVIDFINKTPLVALCGAKFVPETILKKYPFCEACVEICKNMGWKVPSA